MKVFLYQSANGYCYNSDSIFLYAFAKEFKIKGNVLDIGCGVGVLTALLAKDFNAKYYAVEKQEAMYKYACQNFKINKKSVDITNCNFSDYKPDVMFDCIISNPPFYRVDKHQSPNESKNIARYEHHLPLNLLISKVSKLLKIRGYFIFCYDAWQLDDILVELNRNNLKAEFIKFVHPKANKEAKIVMITARKGSKARCKILPPLIVFNDKQEYTKEAKNAFLSANTHSIKAEFEKS
jgi:tRNA1(Val) A37 N6-methylase TrmN6